VELPYSFALYGTYVFNTPLIMIYFILIFSYLHAKSSTAPVQYLESFDKAIK
jgi:hypothetical protein